MKRLALAMALFGAGCDPEATPLEVVVDPVDEDCIVSDVRSFEVFFVIDVSQSLAVGNVLDLVQDELIDFAQSFPEFDVNENRVFVDYYVVGFVNDVAFFPRGSPRMTSPIAVAEALQQAEDAGDDNSNLNSDTQNSDLGFQENFLDAMGAVFDRMGAADRTLIIGATDEDFVDQGDTLTPNIVVQTAYADVARTLAENDDVSLFMFTPGDIEGIDRNFRGQPPLTLDDQFDLTRLGDAGNSIGRILAELVVDTACRPPSEAAQ